MSDRIDSYARRVLSAQYAENTAKVALDRLDRVGQDRGDKRLRENSRTFTKAKKREAFNDILKEAKQMICGDNETLKSIWDANCTASTKGHDITGNELRELVRAMRDAGADAPRPSDSQVDSRRSSEPEPYYDPYSANPNLSRPDFTIDTSTPVQILQVPTSRPAPSNNPPAPVRAEVGRPLGAIPENESVEDTTPSNDQDVKFSSGKQWPDYQLERKSSDDFAASMQKHVGAEAEVFNDLGSENAAAK